MSRRLIAVCTCHQRVYPKHDQAGHRDGESRAKAVRDTWLKNCAGKIEVKFFYGRRLDLLPADDEVFLNCRDDYYGLPEKVRAICRWCTENGYGSVTKIDDDVWLNVPRFIANLPANDYVGYAIESDITYASGTCYSLSKQAMELVARAEIPEGEWREDRHVGRVLLDNGIQLVHDPRYLCCSCEVCTQKYKDPISIHTTSPSQLYSLMEASNE